MTDVMGAVYMDPSKVREWCLKIWACQEKSGWMPHGLKLARRRHYHRHQRHPAS